MSFSNTYEIELSNVRYTQDELEASESDGEKNIERMTFKSYDALVPNDDGYAKEYPLRLSARISKIVVYGNTVTTGSCKTGLRFLYVR